MNSWLRGLACGLAVLLLPACSDDRRQAKVPEKPTHVWQDQTRALDKAKEVEKTVMDAYEQRSKAIDDQTR
jgi:outer membrane biogenesis lipoprotein LolB